MKNKRYKPKVNRKRYNPRTIRKYKSLKLRRFIGRWTMMIEPERLKYTRKVKHKNREIE